MIREFRYTFHGKETKKVLVDIDDEQRVIKVRIPGTMSLGDFIEDAGRLNTAALDLDGKPLNYSNLAESMKGYRKIEISGQ